MNSLVILVHSPLVGPFTWSMVAEQLQQRKVDVLVPKLTDRDDSNLPYWDQHTEAVKQALGDIPQERRVVLVGHSGAGPLLPAIHRAIAQPVAACLFVDAGLPHPGQSRFDDLAINARELAQKLRPFLVSGGSYPNWGAEELREILPDTFICEQLLAELHPRHLRFFEEKMPDVATWPDAPCGYVLFSQAYLAQLEQARRAGWPSRLFHAGHFHMLVDPAAVTASMVELLAEMDQRLRPGMPFIDWIQPASSCQQMADSLKHRRKPDQAGTIMSPSSSVFRLSFLLIVPNPEAIFARKSTKSG